MTSVILQYHRVRAVRVCWEYMDGPETACRLRTQSLSFPIFFAIILMITFLYFSLLSQSVFLTIFLAESLLLGATAVCLHTASLLSCNYLSA